MHIQLAGGETAEGEDNGACVSFAVSPAGLIPVLLELVPVLLEVPGLLSPLAASVASGSKYGGAIMVGGDGSLAIDGGRVRVESVEIG